MQTKTDLGYDEMRRTLRDFSAEAEKADWAVVYYAGHGLEMGGQNYLVPVDARLRSDRDIQFEAVPLDQVMGSIEGAKKLRLVILDACRDNPFLQQMSRSVASRSIGRGLARVEPEGGTLVAYAAKAGQVALDGEGQNSPFVSALMKHMNTPGVEIRRLFGLVRDDVLAVTGKKQEPFVYGSVGGEELFFRRAGQSQNTTIAALPNAITQLADEDNEGVQPDYVDVFRAFKEKAASGDVSAMHELGLLYVKGQNVRQNYTRAHSWFERAAALNFAPSLNAIGVLHQSGWGVPQDLAEAHGWYEKAAAMNEPQAMNNLGILYQNGWGVRQDYTKARSWFEKAAALGHLGAKHNLVELKRAQR